MSNKQKIDAGTIGLRLSPYWWAFVIRGIFFILFDVFFVLYPASARSLFSVTYRTFFLVEAAVTLSKGILFCFMIVENKCELMIFSILNAGSVLVGVRNFLAIISPVASAEGTILILSLWMISVGINQLSLAWLVFWVRPSGYSGSGFIWWIVMTVMTFLIACGGNLEGKIGTIVLILGMCLAMYGVQLIFFGVGLLRTYGNGDSPVTATSTTIDV